MARPSKRIFGRDPPGVKINPLSLSLFSKINRGMLIALDANLTLNMRTPAKHVRQYNLFSLQLQVNPPFLLDLALSNINTSISKNNCDVIHLFQI
jgi:hypothetical protein